MNEKEFENRLIGIHNVMTGIYVHGDDAIRMAGALTELRAIVTELSRVNEPTKEGKEQVAV